VENGWHFIAWGREGLPENVGCNEAKTVQAGFQVAFPITQAKGYLKVKLK